MLALASSREQFVSCGADFSVDWLCGSSLILGISKVALLSMATNVAEASGNEGVRVFNTGHYRGDICKYFIVTKKFAQDH